MESIEDKLLLQEIEIATRSLIETSHRLALLEEKLRTRLNVPEPDPRVLEPPTDRYGLPNSKEWAELRERSLKLYGVDLPK